MEAADASRICRYHSPQNPSKICGAPLMGRGRSKWCLKHGRMIRREQQRLGCARWQKTWRQKHKEIDYWRRRAYRRVAAAQKLIDSIYKQRGRNSLHNQLLSKCKYLADPSIRQFLFSLPLPNEFHAHVIPEFNPRLDLTAPIADIERQLRENSISILGWFVCDSKLPADPKVESLFPEVIIATTILTEIFVDAPQWTGTPLFFLPLHMPSGNLGIYVDKFGSGKGGPGELLQGLFTFGYGQDLDFLEFSKGKGKTLWGGPPDFWTRIKPLIENVGQPHLPVKAPPFQAPVQPRRE